jgi:hypothetical protein
MIVILICLPDNDNYVAGLGKQDPHICFPIYRHWLFVKGNLLQDEGPEMKENYPFVIII